MVQAEVLVGFVLDRFGEGVVFDFVERYPGKTHEGHRNKPCRYKGDPHSFEPFRDVAIGKTFADGCNKCYGKPPAKTGRGDVDKVGKEGVVANNREETGPENGAVDSD